eukprot:s2486_g5.t1
MPNLQTGWLKCRQSERNFSLIPSNLEVKAFFAMKLLLLILQLTLALTAKYRSVSLVPEPTQATALVASNKTQADSDTETDAVAGDATSDNADDAEGEGETETEAVDSPEVEDAKVDPAESAENEKDVALIQEDGAEDDTEQEDDKDDKDAALIQEEDAEPEESEEPELEDEEESMDTAEDAAEDMKLAAETVAVNETIDRTLKETSVKEIPGIGKVLVKTEGDQKWVLLMKLSQNQFCQDSARWTDGQAYNADKMLDDSMPNHRQYDAKSIAFHLLDGIDAVKLQTNTVEFGPAPEVHFKFPSTAENLITTNNVDIIGTGDFNTKKYWDEKWSKAYGHSRNRAPAFMRANSFVRNPAPECRTNPQDRPSGCGKTCMFCMQAGDGSGCPVRSAHNDISKGIGNSRHFCGGGDGNDCSSSGNWAGDRRTLVWGRMRSGQARSIYSTYTMDYGGDVLVRHSGGETWALVMKLSKNDFCHNSPRWTDGVAFKPEKMFDTRIPKHQEYDAKSLAFHKLEGVTAIKIQTNRKSFKDSVVIEFDEPGTPEKLITTNDIKISPKHDFNKKVFWQKWEHEYGHSRDRAPAFMRANKFVTDPAPECRTNPQDPPSGCGKACVFCMQAGDGHGCPVKSQHNDISVGIGLSQSFCGGGNRADCSSSGNWVGDTRTLVWAKWSCEKHEVGQCQGSRHFGICGDLELDDCDTHFVHVMTDEDKNEGAFLQCATVDGQCVAKGPACFGSCANAFIKG